MRANRTELALRRKIADMHRAYTASHKSPDITGCEEAKMVVARVILMSAMLTAGIVEATKATSPHPAAEVLAGEARKAAPADAPAEMSRAVPVSTAPGGERACTEAAWPYRPGSCLRPDGAPQGAEPRRPVRMIEEQSPAAPVRMPGRVSVG